MRRMLAVVLIWILAFTLSAKAGDTAQSKPEILQFNIGDSIKQLSSASGISAIAPVYQAPTGEETTVVLRKLDGQFEAAIYAFEHNEIDWMVFYMNRSYPATFDHITHEVAPGPDEPHRPCMQDYFTLEGALVHDTGDLGKFLPNTELGKHLGQLGAYSNIFKQDPADGRFAYGRRQYHREGANYYPFFYEFATKSAGGYCQAGILVTRVGDNGAVSKLKPRH